MTRIHQPKGKFRQRKYISHPAISGARKSNKFVKDLELELGEFLVFWFNVGDSTFDVSVYGTNCCERNISAMAMESQGMVTKTRPRRCIPPNETHHIRFQLLLKESRKSRWMVGTCSKIMGNCSELP